MNDRISHDYPVPKRTVFLRMSFGCWLTRWRRAVRRRPHIHRPMPKRANWISGWRTNLSAGLVLAWIHQKSGNSELSGELQNRRGDW